MSQPTKLLYLILFILLVIHPHFITGHIFAIPQAYAQSVVMVLIALIGYTVYLRHLRDIREREKAKNDVKRDLEISSKKLSEAFQYIGLINRRLPLLKELTTELLSKSNDDAKSKKGVFQDLLATAVMSIAKAEWGMLRFVDITDNRVVREFIYTRGNYALLKTAISNVDLVNLSSNGEMLKKFEDLYIIVSSNKKDNVRAYLIFPKSTNSIANEVSLLQAVVDQAKLFQNYLFSNQ